MLSVISTGTVDICGVLWKYYAATRRDERFMTDVDWRYRGIIQLAA